MSKVSITQEVQNSEFFSNLNKGLICIDNSTFESIQCPYKFLTKAVLKRKPVGNRAPLINGQAVHECLEMYYRSGLANDLKKLDDKTISGLVEHTVNKYGATLDMCMDTKRNSSTLSSILFSYFHHVRAFGEYLQPITINGELMVEKSFSLPLGTIDIENWFGFSGPVTIMWEGKIDLIACDRRSGDIGTWDHKTTSMLGETFIDAFVRSNQFNGYLWASNEIAKREIIEPINTVGINAICNKSKGCEFKHYMFKRSDWHYNVEFPTFVINSLAKYFHAATHETNRFNCVGKYGKCEFFDLCEVRPEDRLNQLINSGAYELSTWSPLSE